MAENRYDENGNLLDSAHRQDHHYINELRKKEESKKEMTDKVKTSVYTAIIWSIISGIGAVVWFAINSWKDKQ